MTFQYFFFDTYPGYFLQVLPIALIVSSVYGIIRFKNKNESKTNILGSCMFVCYLTGLICLVVLKDVIGQFWYNLIYNLSDGGSSIRLFVWNANFTPNGPNPNQNININMNIVNNMKNNLLMFLPFGTLYPLHDKHTTLKKTILVGIVLILIIEFLQPIFGRSFDINDIILNSLGVILSSFVFNNIIKK